MRKAIPIIGLISSGKSYFLNSLLGINYLQSSNNTTTKFVCIIRHNPTLMNPRFYQVQMIQNINQEGIIEYNEQPLNNIIVGENKIISKIEEINEIQSKIPKNEIKYEELFYVLEIKINNIQNREILENYDFYDIPGLDEFIPSEKENENNIQDNMKYIPELFKFFKTKIKFGIIIINAEQHYSEKNIILINKVADSIAPLKFKNFLIILNKIDRVSDQEYIFKEAKAHILNNLKLNILNPYDNFFLPLDSRELRHQTLMKTHFEDYFMYFFNNYVTLYIIPYKDGAEAKNGEKNSKVSSFRDYLLSIIIQNQPKETVQEYLEKLAEEFDENFDEEKFQEIQLIFEKAKKTENYDINYGIDLEDDEISINVLKGLYICFEKKINIPCYSKNVKNIFKYFDMDLERLNIENPAIYFDDIDDKEKNLKEKFEAFNNLFKKFKDYNKNIEIIKTLSDDIGMLSKYIFNKREIYIPLFGNSSSGKSLILNDICGFNIFPVNQKECTKRGIIIKYGENIAIYTAKKKIEDSFAKKFYVFEKDIFITEGINNVRECLFSYNSKWGHQTKNDDLVFFIITAPIAFLDNYNFPEEIKRKVNFMDLPGNNTIESNRFEFLPIIETASSFIFISKTNEIISENSNLNKIYDNIKYNAGICESISNIDFLKNCLFIINLFEKDEFNENNLMKWRDEISIVLYLDEESKKETKIACFDALSYNNYMKKVNYFCKFEILFKKLYEAFDDQKYNLISFFNESNFAKFSLKSIKTNISDCKIGYDKKIKIEPDQNIKTEINQYFFNYMKLTNYNPSLDKKYDSYLTEISKMLTYAQKNIKNIEFYKKSHCEYLFKTLEKQIGIL